MYEVVAKEIEQRKDDKTFLATMNGIIIGIKVAENKTA